MHARGPGGVGPPSVLVAVLVPDWLTTNSTSWCFWRICFCAVVLSVWHVVVRDAVVGVGRADHAEDVAAVRDVARVGVQTPEHPVVPASAWPCVSCPSTNVTWTSEQLTVPSSGSVTVTLYGMSSPKANVPPSTGVLTVHRRRRVARSDHGARRGGLAAGVRDREDGGVAPTRRVGVLGFGSMECALPSPKSHSKRIESPGSGSSEPALEKLTVSGTGPSVRSVVSTALGARGP